MTLHETASSSQDNAAITLDHLNVQETDAIALFAIALMISIYTCFIVQI